MEPLFFDKGGFFVCLVQSKRMAKKRKKDLLHIYGKIIETEIAGNVKENFWN